MQNAQAQLRIALDEALRTGRITKTVHDDKIAVLQSLQPGDPIPESAWLGPPSGMGDTRAEDE